MLLVHLYYSRTEPKPCKSLCLLPDMMSRTLLLRAAGGALTMKRDQLLSYIMKITRPEPGEADAWAIGVFKEDPDEESLTREFVAFGGLKDCADAVAGCLSRAPKLLRSRMRIVSIQGQIDAIDCRSTDFSF
jgi:hypothetical protein